MKKFLIQAIALTAGLTVYPQKHTGEILIVTVKKRVLKDFRTY